MKTICVWVWVGVVSCLCAGGLVAQQTDSNSATSANNLPAASQPVPRLIMFSGTVKDLTGKPMTGPVDLNFAIYKEQTDAAPLWQESQTLNLDEQGRYTVLLGAMQQEGLPVELFTTGEARWLGVSAGTLPEQSRTLLVSVPYALKAGDAETLGGKPASAFMLAQPQQTSGTGTTLPSGVAVTPNTAKLGGSLTANVAGVGTKNYLPLWTDSTGTLGNSVIYQSLGLVGIGTTTPAAKLDVAGSVGHFLVDTSGAQFRFTRGSANYFQAATAGGYFDFVVNGKTPSDANASLKLAANGVVNFMAGNVGIGTLTPAQKLDVSGNLKITGAGNAIIFPDGTVQSTAGSGSGGGTITGVTAGTGLSGGGTAGNVTLSLASSSCTAGSALTGLPLTCQPFATLGGNTFTGNQSITGNVTATGSVTAVSFTGSGAGLTALNASNLSSGTIPSGRISGTYSNALTFNNTSNSFTGNGAGLTNLTAANISSGTASISISGNAASATNALALGGLSPASFAQLSTSNTFAGRQVINGNVGDPLLAVTQAGAGGGIESILTSTTDGTAAIRGSASGVTGRIDGVVGTTSSPDGAGVSGTGPHIGVYGKSDLTSGYHWGVFGENSSAQGAGVLGQASVPGGSGIFGVSTPTEGNGSGIYGLTYSPDGVAAVFANNGGGRILEGYAGDGLGRFSVDGAGNIWAYGNVQAASFLGNGSGLTSVHADTATTATSATNAAALGGVGAANYARQDASNSFTNTQTIGGGDLSVASGNISLPETTSASAGVINLGGSRFIHACCDDSQHNTFVGIGAGNFTATGPGRNTAAGFEALSSSTTGAYNTASGTGALHSNTEGSVNTANGTGALQSNTTGNMNTASGGSALGSNSLGSNNTAGGFGALASNTTGSNSTASGAAALINNTTGYENTAGGFQSLYDNTEGHNNTAFGPNSGTANTTGSFNTFLGASADSVSGDLTNATAVGAGAVVAQSDSLILGNSANVGIGTSAPSQKLEVVGNILASGSVSALSFSGDGSALTNVTAGTATDLNCTGCVSPPEVTFNYAGSASQGGAATSALAADTATDALNLGGVSASSFARKDAANTFSDTNAFSGEVTIGAGGISHDGAGLKHSRGALILPAGSTGTTQLTWSSAFADADYTATCQAQDPNSGGNTAGLKVIRIETFTASSITVDVANDAGVQRTGSLHCIAIHD